VSGAAAGSTAGAGGECARHCSAPRQAGRTLAATPNLPSRRRRAATSPPCHEDAMSGPRTGCGRLRAGRRRNAQQRWLQAERNGQSTWGAKTRCRVPQTLAHSDSVSTPRRRLQGDASLSRQLAGRGTQLYTAFSSSAKGGRRSQLPPAQPAAGACPGVSRSLQRWSRWRPTLKPEHLPQPLATPLMRIG